MHGLSSEARKFYSDSSKFKSFLRNTMTQHYLNHLIVRHVQRARYGVLFFTPSSRTVKDLMDSLKAMKELQLYRGMRRENSYFNVKLTQTNMIKFQEKF